MDDSDERSNDSLDFEDENELASNEDTDDASETEMVKKKEEFTEIKEQMYQDRLAQLKRQLQQLKDGTLPEYMKRKKKIEQNYRERLHINEVWHEYELRTVERDHIYEQQTSLKEFEDKKNDLKDTLIMELKEKKKMIDNERNTTDLSSSILLDINDALEVKPITTRKLRRRPNDPVPLPEKRRKASPAQLNLLLDEEDVMEDLHFINKIGGKPLSRNSSLNINSSINDQKTATRKPVQSVSTLAVGSPANDIIFESYIDEGRLCYERKWFQRGQSIYIDSKESGRLSAVITAIGTQEVWLRKISDNSKMRIYVSQLQKGKYSIKRRT